MTKSRFVKILSIVLIVVVLSLSLTACLKIGLKKNNLISKLNEEGFTVNYIYRTPMTTGAGSKYKYDDILYVYKEGVSNNYQDQQIDGGVSGSESGTDDASTKSNYIMYVIYCTNEQTADFTEDQCETYIALEDNATQCLKWVVYRYDNIVFCGNIEIVAVARGY